MMYKANNKYDTFLGSMNLLPFIKKDNTWEGCFFVNEEYCMYFIVMSKEHFVRHLRPMLKNTENDKKSYKRKYERKLYQEFYKKENYIEPQT